MVYVKMVNRVIFLSLMEFYQFRNLCKDVRRMWPCFRGIRAGRRVRERANRCRYPIEAQLTNRMTIHEAPGDTETWLIV